MFLCLFGLLSAQNSGDFAGEIKSGSLSGSGDRNVVAAPDGTLIIEAAGSGLPANPQNGEMLYFDGTSWQTIPKGNQGETLNFCNCVPTWGPCPPLQIGDMFGGGVIFYLDASGTSGLIAAKNDLATAPWGCQGTIIAGADGQAIGTGAQNTIDILAGCMTANIAADLCDGATINGFSDWFLPSVDELSEMYFEIGQGASGANQNVGMFGNAFYWSSSENTASFARIVNFGNGSGASGPQSSAKGNVFSVRPIRAF